jgi:hypothetical protein
MARDRRKSRHRADCEAEILVRELPPTRAVAIDLSLGGAFLETDAALPLGLRVKVRFTPDHGDGFTVSGHILRVGYADKTIDHPELDYLVVRASGLAVKFDPLEPESAGALRRYLDSLPAL